MGQNQPKTVFLVKTHFFQSKSTKTTLFSQHQPNPPFLVKNQFFRPKLKKTQFFWSKSTQPRFPGQKPVFSAQVAQNQFFWPKSTKPSLSVKIAQNRGFRSKTGGFGQNQPNQFFRSKSNNTRFLRQKLLFSVKIVQTWLFRAKPGVCSQN